MGEKSTNVDESEGPDGKVDGRTGEDTNDDSERG